MNHGPWLALGPRWTHYHGATRASQILGTHPLRGMGGRRDSLVREREREREEEEVVKVLTIGATWQRGCGDDRAMALNMALNRSVRWCSDEEMVPDTWRGDWSWGLCGGEWGCSQRLL
jgi:hypothetical protein